jgi:hypothetical protein
MARQFAPAIGGDLAIFGIEPDDDLTGEGAARIMQKTGILHGRRTDDDVGQTVIKIALDGVKIANPTTELDRNLVNAVFFGVLANG